MAAFDAEDVDFLDVEDVDAAVASLSLGDNLSLNISMESIESSSSSPSASTTSTIPAFHSDSSSSSSDFVIGEWLRSDEDISIEQLNMLIEACGNFNFGHKPQLEAVEAKLEMEKKVNRERITNSMIIRLKFDLQPHLPRTLIM